MSGRIFQNVVLQIKEATDRVIGVIDAEKILDALQLEYNRSRQAAITAELSEMGLTKFYG